MALATPSYNTTFVSSDNAADTVYGLFVCNRDTPPQISKPCLIEAAKLILSLCTTAKEAIIWYGVCYVHYSDRNFFSTMEESPKLTFMNEKDYVGEGGRFNSILWDMLNDMRTKAVDDSHKLAEKAVNITTDQKVYGSAWCLQYLSTEDCRWCLSDAIAEVQTVCCRGKTGGTILFPSCGVRYELYPFLKEHNIVPLVPPPPLSKSPRPPAPPGKGKQKKSTTTIIVIPIVVAVVLLSLGCCCFLRRKERKNQDDILKESFGKDISTLESLQFELAKIEAATNRFATENMVGKGGFGEVYKGILPDGQEIAVKRLTGSSKQGAEEFKNEVLVIAKLQHRNLVRLLGFCLEGGEKILVYEYVPNKSLDYFLLDPQKRRLLSWHERQKIITGIARGILYLHEDSRLKIIHRDLKPSNVLLDSNMNPKISDFGMAKIVAVDQTEESTCRIVGTYGYMSPEYAMHGQFSVKSDVFSFGVMVLEIINGKWKGGSSRSKCVNDIRRHLVGHESNTLEGLQFDLPIIEEATNNFSHENMIGKGGFGEVYKGILSDGRHIAVKRLSTNSRQGTQQQKLSSTERYKIIGRTALGILYLHEYSRLKVIYGDLKPSNILLDENMNPKISDFGIARIVEIDQDRGKTNRIVGTYGYMSPKYAMLGQFSENSAVFSFGVIVIEIIARKRNVNSYESLQVAEGLLSYVWREWKEGRQLSILDPNLNENYSQAEVIKCIQIGLLCVQQNPDARPTMATVVSYLKNQLLDNLPSPKEPSFFLHSKMDPKTIAQESSSSQSANSSTPFSINEMSISNKFYPR